MLALEISAGITTRLKEAQDVLRHLKQIEADLGQPDSSEVRLLRGLFYVHLYGVFEYGVTSIVQATIEKINAESIRHCDLGDSIGVFVLHSQFNAVEQASPQNQWRVRMELIKQRRSADTAKIVDGAVIFQNIMIKNLEQLFLIFGVQSPAVYDVTKGGYINELTTIRNKISHGLESPQEIGMKRRSIELQNLHDVISRQIFYMIDCFDSYLRQRGYSS